MLDEISATLDRINATGRDMKFSAELVERGAGYGVRWTGQTDTSLMGGTVRWYSELSACLYHEAALIEAIEKTGEHPVNIFKDTDLFPYMSGMMFSDKPVVMTIERVGMEELRNGKDSELKPVLFFKGTKKGLVLNKTNAKTLAKHFGPETSDWQGERVTLYAIDISAFGERHRTVRVDDKLPRARRNGNAPTADEVNALADELGAEVEVAA